MQRLMDITAEPKQIIDVEGYHKQGIALTFLIGDRYYSHVFEIGWTIDQIAGALGNISHSIKRTANECIPAVESRDYITEIHSFPEDHNFSEK